MNKITWKDLDPDMRWKYVKQRMDFNKDMKLQHVCVKPFSHISIDVKGRCFLCDCSATLPISVGNVLDFNSLQEIQDNEISNHIQSTVIDGTYRYCDLSTCGYLENVQKQKFAPITRTTHLHIAVDSSCNLSCPSCRKEMIFIKPGDEDYSHREKMLDHIARLIGNHDFPLSLVCFTDGEVFASTLYGDFLKKLSFKNPDSKIIIFTNGTLIKQKWSIIEHLEKHVSNIQISIDSVTKPVFENLRRGANWEKLIENLDWLHENKSEMPVTLFYVAQLSNIDDMLEIPRFLERYPRFHMSLWEINDWASLDNFDEHAIWKETNPFYFQYLENVEKLKGIPRINLTKLQS